jgi:hypothetical protein
VDAYGREQRGHAGGGDQHVVVALVVAAPGSVGVGHKGGDLAYEPVGFGQRELGDDRPVAIDQAGIRGVAPGLAEGKIADIDGEQAAGPQRPPAIAVNAWPMAGSLGR